LATLLAYCHEHGFDLIVVGHHHSGRAGRLLLQGVAPRLIEAAEVPVLVVGKQVS
jgi:nucleotide-binding universal stress UspA family protein